MHETISTPLARRGLRRVRTARLRLACRWTALRGRALRALAGAIELAVIGLSYLALPLWPFGAAAVARDFSYVRRYPATLRRAVLHVQGALRGHSVFRFVLEKLGQRKLRRDPMVGACTHCGNCCLYRGCLFLAYDAGGQSRCRIYGGRVWKMLACADYPINSEEVVLYDCPSFVAMPRPEARKVVPIAAVGLSHAAPRLASAPGAHAAAPKRQARGKIA